MENTFEALMYLRIFVYRQTNYTKKDSLPWGAFETWTLANIYTQRVSCLQAPGSFLNSGVVYVHVFSLLPLLYILGAENRSAATNTLYRIVYVWWNASQRQNYSISIFYFYWEWQQHLGRQQRQQRRQQRQHHLHAGWVSEGGISRAATRFILQL